MASRAEHVASTRRDDRPSPATGVMRRQDRGAMRPEQILGLQRTVGNAAVARALIQRSVDEPVMESDLVTMSDEAVQSRSDYFENGISVVTYHGEEHYAEVSYEDGASLVVETVDVRTQPRSRSTPGLVHFGVSPEDLIEPEVPPDYYSDDTTGRIRPFEITVENAPVFTACLREAKATFEQGTHAVAEAGLDIYSDPDFLNVVLAPGLNQLLTVSPSGGLASRVPARSSRAPAPAQPLALPAGSGGVISIQRGAWFNQDEWRAVNYLYERGYRLLLRKEAAGGKRRISDMLLVKDGVGIPLDIYTPNTAKLTRIVKQVVDKYDQVRGGVVLVQLHKCGLTPDDFGPAFARAYKAAAKNPHLDDGLSFLDIVHLEQREKGKLPFIQDVILVP